MFVEERCYQVLPGQTAEYLELYEAHGMTAQLRHLPLMLGYYASEIGPLNEIVHLWGHMTLDDRDRRRAAMRADAEFQTYWIMVRPLIVAQRTRVMKPARFFLPRLLRMVETIAGGSCTQFEAPQVSTGLAGQQAQSDYSPRPF